MTEGMTKSESGMKAETRWGTWRLKAFGELQSFGVLVVVTVGVGVAGCTSDSKAKSQARAAYLAGQQEAMFRLQQQSRNPSVTIIGNVQNPTIPWTSELTLAKAIVAAGYMSRRDPSQIFIVRNGQAIPVDAKQLLNGEDVPLESGDMVQIK
jgi:hypothetical protein